MAGDERKKGHDTLLDAWPAVRTNVPTAELWVAGEGDDRPRLEERARALALQDSVRFLGLADTARLGELYRRAAVYAMPSRQEGFGIAFAEAMWHGLPCIGTTADASHEVIVQGETGLLIQYGDAAALAAALRQLLGDPDLRARMGAAGSARARELFVYPRFRDRLQTVLGLAPAA
jgi:phosphatidylinositol alpha-1,6-mannosyltransferase